MLEEINLLIALSHVAVNPSLKGRHCSHFTEKKKLTNIKIKIFVEKNVNEVNSQNGKKLTKKTVMETLMIEDPLIQLFSILN